MAINELTFSNLMFKFDFTVPDGAKNEELDISEMTGLTIHKNVPLLTLVKMHSGY